MKDSLEKGIQEIELAAPGLNFEQTTSPSGQISVLPCVTGYVKHQVV